MAAVLLAFGLALAASAVFAEQGSEASASDWVKTEHGAVRLISAVNATGDASTVPLGLEFRLEDGWKIYWRSPGDAGYPPRIDWDGSANLAQVDVLWPAPLRFSVLDLETLGYEGHVVLPLAARPVQTGGAVHLQASVDYLICKDVCIPYDADLRLFLPAGPATPSAFAPSVAEFAGRVPLTEPSSSFAIERAELQGDGQNRSLAIEAHAEAGFSTPDVFIEGPAEIAFGAPKVRFDEDRRRARLMVPVHGNAAALAALPGNRLTVTLVDGDRGVEQAIEPVVSGSRWTSQEGLSTPPGIGLGESLPFLGLALLGGLILNLMPCVLPVLSIKLLSVIRYGGGDRRVVRVGFLATAAGILTSFLVLAGALIALRSAGVAAGWGVQFQQPWFLIAMTIIVALFACNLWGMLEIPLPRWIAATDAHASRTQGLVGNFLTGTLATLLATPCSAPFVGTAIGFALARGPSEIIAVFIALAAGLALPYLLVAAFPALATRLPRPGHWMLTLRRILGLALFGTAVWLVTVLAAHSGPSTAVAVGTIVCAIVLLIAARHRLGADGGWLMPFAIVSFSGIALLLPGRDDFVASGSAASRASETGKVNWQPFDLDEIQRIVSDGKIVFVNVTAEWCLTCRVNERLVLGRDPVQSALAGSDVITMQADWTKPNEAITRYLSRFGRYGIPFDAVYGPSLQQGEALPELLTPEVVLAALERARGEPRAVSGRER